jgi:hypothetical protein
MNHINAIALNLISLGLGSLRGLSLGDVALIIAWTLILIMYVAGQGLRFLRNPDREASKARALKS